MYACIYHLFLFELFHTLECTKDKQICIFPFKYGSNLHSNCLNSGGSESWCATSVNADRTYKGWGYCGGQMCSGNTLCSKIFKKEERSKMMRPQNSNNTQTVKFE